MVSPDYLAKITGYSRSGNPIQGTGVQITTTLILTCKHVLEPQGESGPPESVQILIANQALTAHPLEPANPSHSWDLALLQIQGGPLPAPERAWKWEHAAIKTKPNIPLLGFPEGEYSDTERPLHCDDPKNFAVTGKIHKGASGGAAEWWQHPHAYCFGLIQARTGLTVEIITEPTICAFLKANHPSVELPRLPQKPQPLESFDDAPYRQRIRDTCGSVKLKLRVGKNPIEPGIDQIWVPCRMHSQQRDLSRETPDHGTELLSQALERHRVIVIQGKAGSGKTLFLQRIAYAICRLDRDRESTLQLGPWAKLPLLVTVKELEEYIRTHNEQRPASDPQWISRYLASDTSLGLPARFFEAKLHEPGTILLLDGLDEASTDVWRDAMAELFLKAVQRYPNAKLVFTTRPEAEQTKPLLDKPGVARIEVLPFRPEDIRQFLDLWFAAVPPANQENPEQSKKRLLDRLGRSRELRDELSPNPLMLTMLAALHCDNRELPHRRAELYDAIIDYLLKLREQKQNHDTPLQRHQYLNRLAWAMQKQPNEKRLLMAIGDAAKAIEDAFRAVPQADRYDRAKEFLEAEQTGSGIVTLRGKHLTFWHRSFQEFLAAQRIASLVHETDSIAVQLLAGRNSLEVLLVLAGCLALTSEERPDTFFRGLVDWTAQQDFAGKAYGVGVIGGLLADLKQDYVYQDPGGVYADLRKSVMDIFEDKPETRAIPIASRAKTAEALAQGIDPRLRLPGDPDYWVEIPAGSFAFGGDKKAYQSPRKAKTLRIDAFAIGRYPVTVHEYQVFLEVMKNYPKPDDWDKQATCLSRPVVNVSWEDAREYCAWVTQYYEVSCKLVTEQQWEYVARGEEGRAYPWGDQSPDPTRGNFGKTGLGEPSPVGLFPAGAAGRTAQDKGVLDLFGNVWEWTRSDFKKARAEKVLRGASYLDDYPEFLRAACRDFYRPVVTGGFVGFRCVRE